MQLDPAPWPGEPFPHELGMMIARVVEKDICGRPSLASTFFWRFERFGRLRSYVRPLSVRSICPRALMKSDDRDPYHGCELSLMFFGGLFLVFGGDRVVHHVSLRLPNSNL